MPITTQRKLTTAAFGAIAGLALMPNSAWAETTDEGTTTLPPLVVTAAGFEQDVTDAPASITVIDSEKLNSGAYEDITDALRDVPGVIVTGGGAGDNGADISMRGMPASYSLILVDGKRQGSRESRPNGSAGFEQDWLPPLAAIERIEVVRGPMSTLYGSDAMGGVINVITRKVPREWSGNVEVSTIIQEDQDSGNIQQTNFNMGGALVEDLVGLQVYGRQYSREEDKIVNGYEEKDLQSATARLSITPNQSQDIVLEAGITDQRRRSTVGNSTASTGCYGGCEDSDTKHTRRYYSASHTGRWSFGTTDSYVQREETENKGRDITITNTVAKSSLVMPIANHTATLGVDFEREELDDTTTNTISDLTELDNNRWAMFAEDEWQIVDSFALTAGVRVDDDQNFGSHVSPRLYGVWRFAPTWTLKGGVSTGYHAPSLRELSPDWGQVSRGGNVYGNPDLEPETSVTEEIGLHYSNFSGLTGSVTVFNNDFKDKITRVTCPTSICPGGANDYGNYPTYRINVDDAVSRGVEASLGVPLTNTLQANASYTYTYSRQESGEYEGEPLTQLPKHQATLGLDWEATSQLKPWLRVTYRGEESNPTTGPSQDATIAPSYTFVDSGLTFAVTEQTTLKAGVYNLFDEDVTYDEYGYTEDGRRYWLALNVGF